MLLNSLDISDGQMAFGPLSAECIAEQNRIYFILMWDEFVEENKL